MLQKVKLPLSINLMMLHYEDHLHSLLVLIIVVEVESLHLDLDVGLCSGGDQLLKPHQAVVILIQQCKRFPSITFNQTFVSLEVIVRYRLMLHKIYRVFQIKLGLTTWYSKIGNIFSFIWDTLYFVRFS